MDIDIQNCNSLNKQKKTFDIRGTICPYAVVKILRYIEDMKSGESLAFLVDDPLATKSVPEETAEMDNIFVSISKAQRHWIISVTMDG
jgi:TusA-related sulfurtransferase